MTAMQIIFLLTAVVTLVSALRVVTTPNMIHAALWLVTTLVGVAVLYVLLSASFLAVAQVVIYVGAIAILMMFVIMLTRREMRDRGPQTGKQWPWAAVLAVLLFGGLVWMVQSVGLAAAPVGEVPQTAIADLGKALVSPNGFVIPFEVASVLLLAALIGAVYVAWTRRHS